jgi:hypothetical protein
MTADTVSTGGESERWVPPLPPLLDFDELPQADDLNAAATATQAGAGLLAVVTAWVPLAVEHGVAFEDLDAVRRHCSILAGLADARDLPNMALLEATRRAEYGCARVGDWDRTDHLATTYTALFKVEPSAFEDALTHCRALRTMSPESVIEAAGLQQADREATLRFRVETLAGQGRPSQAIADELALDVETVRAMGQRHRIEFPGDTPAPERPADPRKYLEELLVDLAAIGKRAAVLTREDLERIPEEVRRDAVRGIWDGAAPAVLLRSDIERSLRS